jgi:hypothetical protein
LAKVSIDFNDNSTITSDIIKKFFKAHLFEKFNPYFLPENYCKENGRTFVKHAEQNLFIWCVLFNQIEIAKLFWSIGDVSYYSIKFYK